MRSKNDFLQKLRNAYNKSVLKKIIFNFRIMTTVTFKQDIKLSNNIYIDFTSFIDDFSKNNFPNSNIENEYEIASDMKKNGLPESFIKNFVKSYE